jgi:hypothetical protein
MDARQQGSLFQTIVLRTAFLGMALYFVVQGTAYFGHALHTVTATLAVTNAAVGASK